MCTREEIEDIDVCLTINVSKKANEKAPLALQCTRLKWA
jgi:hypothetical protein